MSNVLTTVLQQVDGGAGLATAEVVDVTQSGSIVVRFGGGAADVVHADLLVTTDAAPPVLMPGDTVLAWRRPGAARPVVLGRVGPSLGVTPAVPDTLTIEARQSLTIRVGDGSITIREDGKVLIKGKDLVSHAQRTNRIKGGAVSIN